jgi:hypothetical protein
MKRVRRSWRGMLLAPTNCCVQVIYNESNVPEPFTWIRVAIGVALRKRSGHTKGFTIIILQSNDMV